MMEVERLSVVFQKEEIWPAVDELDFTIEAKQTVALLGESGCGKSLTALSLMRLLPSNAYYSSQSKVLFHTADILELPENLMRALRGKKISIIFQEPMTALNPVLRIDHQLYEALRKNHNNKYQKEALLLALLEKVEIDEPQLRLRQYPHQLSGGQKQRIMIAMALANNPEVLIADEPTTALDVTTQKQILKLLKKLQQDYGMSILLITHDLGVVKEMAEKVYVMYAGQLVEKADRDAFFTEVKHPYSQQLLASLPTL